MKPRNLFLSILWLCLTLTLIGCAKIHVTTKINANGSGENTVIFALDTRQVGPGSIMWTSLEMNKQEAVKAGAQAVAWQDGRYEGYKLTYKFANLDELSKSLAQSTSSRDSGRLFSEVNASMSDDKKIRLSAKGDFRSLTSMGQELNFTVIMPGHIITYTEQSAATQPSTNQITWDIMKLQGRQVELTAIGETGGLFGILPCPSIGLIAGLLVVPPIVISRRAKRRPRWITTHEQKNVA